MFAHCLRLALAAGVLCAVGSATNAQGREEIPFFNDLPPPPPRAIPELDSGIAISAAVLVIGSTLIVLQRRRRAES